MIENMDFISLMALITFLGIAGFFAGICAGLFGVGGGIIVVPVLFYFFNFLNPMSSVNMHVAIGTSLGIIIATGFSSALAHAQRGAVDKKILRYWGPWIALGAILGSLLLVRVVGLCWWVFLALLYLLLR